MAQTIPSHALWSDVTVPQDQTGLAFHQWLLEQGLDPEQAMFRGAVHGETLIGVEVWSPLPGQTAPRSPLDNNPSTLDWPAPGSVIELDQAMPPDELQELLEELFRTLNDTMLIPASAEPRPFELAPQAWRVIAHLAHWEDHKFFGDDDRASFEISRVSPAGRAHPLDRRTFDKVRESFLNGPHLSSMSMDQYHAWYGRSAQQLTPQGTLNDATLERLHARLAPGGVWHARSGDEQQAFAHKLIKPHPLHEHLVNQAVERWHLQGALDATLPAENLLTLTGASRSRL